MCLYLGVELLRFWFQFLFVSDVYGIYLNLSYLFQCIYFPVHCTLTSTCHGAIEIQ